MSGAGPASGAGPEDGGAWARVTGVGQAVIAELADTIAAQGKLLDWEAVWRLAIELSRARRVLAFGAGRSRSVALGFAQRLTHVGLAVAMVGESANTRCGAQDMVVVVSGSGQTASALAIAEQARAAGAGVLCAITATPDSPLATMADLVCLVQARAKGAAAAGVAPYTAQFDAAAQAVTEAISRMVMELRGVADEEIESWRPNIE